MGSSITVSVHVCGTGLPVVHSRRVQCAMIKRYFRRFERVKRCGGLRNGVKIWWFVRCFIFNSSVEKHVLEIM